MLPLGGVRRWGRAVGVGPAVRDEREHRQPGRGSGGGAKPRGAAGRARGAETPLLGLPGARPRAEGCARCLAVVTPEGSAARDGER